MFSKRRALRSHSRRNSPLKENFRVESLEPRCMMAGEAAFVQQLYNDVLQRAPYQPDVDYWVGQLQAGGSRTTAARALLYSGEYASQQITSLYNHLLGRNADAAGMAYWTQQISSGIREERLVATILASPEYFSVHGGTNTTFVNAVYNDLLGRNADSAGSNFWVNKLNRGMSRFDMTMAYTTATEFRSLLMSDPQNVCPTFDPWFQNYLNRPADSQAINSLIKWMNKGATWRDVQQSLLGSAEYFNLAQASTLVVALGADRTGNEAQNLTFNSTITGPSPITSYAWTFGDGGTASGASSASHAYVDQGVFTVRLTVTDNQGRTASDTLQVSLANLAPTATFSNNGPVVVGGNVQVSFTSPTDASSADRAAGYKYSYDFNNDGTFEIANSTTASATVPTTYLATAGTRVVRGRIIDKDGGFTDYTTSISVVAGLTANAGADKTGNEAQQLSFTGTAAGPSPISTYAWDFGDGGTATGTLTPTHTYADQGVFTVRLTVTDNQGRTASDTLIVTVSNVAPTGTFSNGGSVNEGSAGAVSFSAQNDVSGADRAAGYKYSFDFNNDGTFDVVNSTVASAAVGSSYLADSGSRVVKGRIIDKDGGFTDYTTTIAVNNVAPTATLSNGGAVNEGSAGSVAFSAQSDVTADVNAGFKYSYDFNNDGTWETVDSTSASVAVPAAYLNDGAGTRTVKARIKDKDGGFADYTSTITINNVAPTALPGGPYNASVGGNINFLGGATDPSSVDTNAGFSYSWNFGDGTTSTLANPIKSYAAAGTYTVQLTVTDKDGGSRSATTTATVGASVNVGSFITTPYDKIPNFGHQPTIWSVGNGAWSSASTWNLGRAPVAGDVVAIKNGQTVTYDVVSNNSINTVSIESGGHMVFRTDVDTRLVVQHLLVHDGGELQIGTAANPVAATVKAEVLFANVALDTVNDPFQYGNGLIALGKVTVHGAVLNETFIRLAAEPLAGQNTLTLSQAATGWRIGDKVVIPDTRHLKAAEGEIRGNYTPQWEMHTIQSISADGLTITLAAPLQFDHVGARDGNGNLDFLPHVANLSRNVSIRSQSMSGTRGHVMFLNRADVDVRYAAFAGLGRTTENSIDNTTADANGNVTHVGTNQDDRFSVQFRHLMGPTATPANGYQYTFQGNSVFCPMNPMPFRWGLVVNDAHYGLVKQNVVYNWAGAGIMTRDGNESYNVFERNFGVAIRGKNSPRNNDGMDGSVFWFGGFNNYVRGNVAANGQNTFQDIVSGVGFKYFMPPAPNATDRKIPLFKGANLNIAGQFQTVRMQNVAIPEFSDNEAYGAMASGMTIWNLGTDGYSTGSIGTTTLRNFHVWHVFEEAFFAYPIYKVVLDGFVVRGHTRVLGNANNGGAAWTSNDYWAEDVTIRNADIQGMMYGIDQGTNVNGTFTIENSYLRNYSTNFNVSIAATPGSGASTPPRTTIIRNVNFDAWAGKPLKSIVMNYTMHGKDNVIQRNEVFVYDYDGAPGLNYQVYFAQQAASFVVPQTDSTPGLIGAPVAGLTNAQAWSQYGIAIAGAVAPSNTTSLPEIDGLLRSF